MGLFAKSRPDTQRMLAKGKGSYKASFSQILQLRNSSSSSSYDEDDDGIAPPPFTSDSMDHGENKTKAKKKKKVWRVLQVDSTVQSNAYIPPGTATVNVPIDPFSTTINTTTLSTNLSTNTTLYNQVPPSSNQMATTNANVSTTTKLFAKKKFQRLDSMDDASYENVQGGSTQQQFTNKIIQPPPSESLMPSVSVPKHKKQSTKPTLTRGKSSSMHKDKNSLSKHIKPSSFSKLNCDGTPRSSSSVGGSAIYYPPPTMTIVPTANTDRNEEPMLFESTTSKGHTYPNNEFLMNVIRNSNSTGEEMFDIRSESTGSEHLHAKRTPIENSNPSLQRCHSIGSESGIYSQSVQDSICYSDNGFPIAVKPSNSFQQMIFDDKFQKLTAVTKSETGSNTYSDLAKAATLLTKVLSPEPALVAHRINTVVPPPPPPPLPQTNLVHTGGKPINKAMSKINMTSKQSIKVKSMMRCDNMISSNESVDAMSCTSTHSGKSRGEYKAAIRAKVRSPIKKNKVQATTMSNIGPSTNTITTPISVANATFSNSVRMRDDRSDFSFEQNGSAKNVSNTNPFMIASDFNVTKFSSNNEMDNENDPFQIGNDVIGSGSSDSIWNVTANSFPYLGSSSTSGADSQNSKVEEKQSMNRHQYQYNDQVGKANSMDDALIESIRNAAYMKSQTLHGRKEHRDPSSQEVRISHSDGDLDYAAPPPTDSYRGSGVGRAGDYYYSGPNMQQLKKKTATKGVPANAIIGSMLFRQTQTCDEYGNEDELAKNTRKNSSNLSLKKNKLKESPKSGGLEEERALHDETTSHLSHYKVPRNVHTECSRSDVSSVTEEASSFYTKNLMQHKWNQPAQNILNHYNVQRGNKMMATTLQTRDMNATTMR